MWSWLAKAALCGASLLSFGVTECKPPPPVETQWIVVLPDPPSRLDRSMRAQAVPNYAGAQAVPLGGPFVVGECFKVLYLSRRIELCYEDMLGCSGQGRFVQAAEGNYECVDASSKLF